jgi:hypothetical protein
MKGGVNMSEIPHRTQMADERGGTNLSPEQELVYSNAFHGLIIARGINLTEPDPSNAQEHNAWRQNYHEVKNAALNVASRYGLATTKSDRLNR